MERKELTVIAGNIGQAPSAETLPSGQEVVKFTVARPTGFGKEAPQPEWWAVTVWNDSVKEQVMDKDSGLSKGDAVTVIGTAKVNQVGDKTYRNISAQRLGRTSYIYPDFNQTPSQRAEPETRATADEEDDFPF